jgi:hypothetical protein
LYHIRIEAANYWEFGGGRFGLQDRDEQILAAVARQRVRPGYWLEIELFKR